MPRRLAGCATRSPMLPVLPPRGKARPYVWVTPACHRPQEPIERCDRCDRQTLPGPNRGQQIDSTPNVNHASEMAFFPPLAEGAPCVAASMRF